MNSTLECLNRDTATTAGEMGGAWTDMIARYSTGRPKQTATPQEGHAADFGPFETAKRALSDVGFEPNPADVVALLTLVRELDALREKHDAFSINAIVKRLKSTPPSGPRDDAETEYRKAGPFRAHLKTEMRRRIANFSPTAIALLEEVSKILEGQVAIMGESEREMAFLYGVRFIPSHTLSELGRAAASIREVRGIWSKAPELGDFTLLVRLVEDTPPSFASKLVAATAEAAPPAVVEVAPTHAPEPVEVDSGEGDSGFNTTKQPKPPRAAKGK